MRARAAVLWNPGDEWKVEEINLDAPRQGEVLVRIAASGICHSDEHLRSGAMPASLPMVGGHEGAGVVEGVGPGVGSVKPGDHVVLSWIPACGRCGPCSTGHQNLCDLGTYARVGFQILDQTTRHHHAGNDLHLMACVGTFASHTVVNEASVVKIDDDIPLDRACLVACGVATGWGSAVYAGKVGPGDDVAVIGCGGIGINAVQGARLAGARRIFAIDPVRFKRDEAMRFGATHAASSIDEAHELIQEVTWGLMCKQVIAAMGTGRGELIADLLGLAGKSGSVVVTNLHAFDEVDAKISLVQLTLLEKSLIGSIYGSANPRYDIRTLLALYRDGQLNLDDLVTRTYNLDTINQGFADMIDGKNLRGVVIP